jgi:hypothetical protein
MKIISENVNEMKQIFLTCHTQNSVSKQPVERENYFECPKKIANRHTSE